MILLLQLQEFSNLEDGYLGEIPQQSCGWSFGRKHHPFHGHRWSHGNHDWIWTFVKRRTKFDAKNLAKIDGQESPNYLWKTEKKKKKINFWEYLESVSGFWILRTLFSGEEEHAQKVFLLLNTERHGFPVAILHQGHVKRSVQCRRYQRSLSYQWSEQQQCCSW